MFVVYYVYELLLHQQVLQTSDPLSHVPWLLKPKFPSCLLRWAFDTEQMTDCCWCFIFSSVGTKALDCLPILCSCKCSSWYLPKTFDHRASQGLTVWQTAPIHLVRDITAEVFPFVLIRQRWPHFKAACFFVVVSYLSDTCWLFVPLWSWREGIYCRRQWITRPTITMVIDAFETCWLAGSEIKSQIPEALEHRWRTEEM